MSRALVAAVMSWDVALDQRSVGGLNIYKTADGEFAPAFPEHVQVFAGYAAVAVNNITSYAGAVNEATHLRITMESRAVIEQAKGIVMGRNHCTADEALRDAQAHLPAPQRQAQLGRPPVVAPYTCTPTAPAEPEPG